MSSSDGVVERGPVDVPQGEDGGLRGCPQQEPDVEEEEDDAEDAGKGSTSG